MNFFVSKSQIHDDIIEIVGTDVNHIKNVLRKQIEDEITIVSNNIEYKTKIKDISSNKVECKIITAIERNNEEPEITLFQGLAKADKIEYIIQKCSEIGAREIVPTEMKRCVVKLNQKDKIKKLERWQKIAEVAAKQSLRTNILKVNRIIRIDEICEEIKEYDVVIVAYEKEKTKSLKEVLKEINKTSCKIAIVIGPEGGLEEQEVEKLEKNGAKIVSLGNRILRTETAPIVMCSNIMYELTN